MFKFFQAGTSNFLKIKGPDSAETIIPSGPPQPPPPDFPYIKDGIDWSFTETVITITGGIIRYVTNGDSPTGYFFTDIDLDSPQEARKRLNLPSENEALFKARARIEPTLIGVSYIPGSQTIQIFIADTNKVTFLGVTSTHLTWNTSNSRSG